MADMLVDDTKSCSVGTYGPALGREIASIAQYRVDRYSAHTWAQNLRFLIYDDEGDDHDHCNGATETVAEGISVEDEDAELQKALLLSLMQVEETAASGEGSGMASEGGHEDHIDELLSDTANRESGPIHAKPDDVDDDDDDDDSDSESMKLDYAIALSLAQEEDFLPEKQNRSQSETGPAQAPADRGDDPSKTQSCATCLKYPKFPARPRKFRVVQFSAEDLRGRLCGHYVAVSYCWKSDANGKGIATERSYQVRGAPAASEERTNRAPDEIIDRAVDFARTIGARLIWLDQECLPQDKSEEQELGIQAMDMVYQRAKWCVGLLDSIIPTQRQLDAVASVLDWASTKEQTNPRLRYHANSELTMELIQESLMDFLELFGRDSWNSRAWILQEAFSAANSLMLTIRMAPSIGFRAWSRVLKHNPNMMPGVFSIDMPDVMFLIKASKEFLHMCARLPVPTGVGVSSSMLSESNSQRIFEILEVLDYIHPQPSATTNRHAYMYAVGGPNFGPRKTCNAATALTFLRSRLNHRAADRLAILANLTDYEVRLDTVKIEQSFKSLTICLFALAYINGDLSLLVPEVYQNAKIQAPIEGPSWILPFSEIINSINTTHLRAGHALILRNARRYNFSSSGAVMPAYVWSIKRPVDFTPIKLKWEQHWKNWTCIQIIMNRRENESFEEFSARKLEIHRLVSEGQRIPEALRDGEEPLNWGNNDLGGLFGSSQMAGTHISRILSAARLDQDMGAQWMVGHLFRDILQHLRDINEIPLANGIWHSIRTDCVNRAPESGFTWSHSNWDALPDNVVDLLATEEFTSNPWLQLQLDRNNRGTFNQVWLIDRIMQTGTLWVGNYTPVTSSISATKAPSDRAQDSEGQEKQDQVNQEHKDEDLEGQQTQLQNPEDGEVQESNDPAHRPKRRLFYPSEEEEAFMMAILRANGDEYRQALSDALRMSPSPRHFTSKSLTLPLTAMQTFKLLTAVIFRSDVHKMSQYARVIAVPTSLPLGAFITYVMLSRLQSKMTTQDARLSERVAAFDVDGPCTIATPFDVDMERLPRSVLRSMDICWVVESVDNSEKLSARNTERKNGEQSIDDMGNYQESQADGNNSDEITSRPESTDSSESSPPKAESEEVADTHMNRSKGKAKARDDAHRGNSDIEDYHGDATFRILNRVKGAWEIMEENWHEYEFV